MNTTMIIYHIERTDEYGYDDYSDFVALAESEDEARVMTPSEGSGYEPYGSWTSPENVKVTPIGVGEGPSRVVCASFHAG